MLFDLVKYELADSHKQRAASYFCFLLEKIAMKTVILQTAYKQHASSKTNGSQFSIRTKYQSKVSFAPNKLQQVVPMKVLTGLPSVKNAKEIWNTWQLKQVILKNKPMNFNRAFAKEKSVKYENCLSWSGESTPEWINLFHWWTVVVRLSSSKKISSNEIVSELNYDLYLLLSVHLMKQIEFYWY